MYGSGVCPMGAAIPIYQSNRGGGKVIVGYNYQYCLSTDSDVFSMIDSENAMAGVNTFLDESISAAMSGRPMVYAG